MAVDTSVIGKQTGAWRVVLDRAVLANFAKAVGDTSAVYQRDESRRGRPRRRAGAADVHVRGAVLGARSAPTSSRADPTGRRRQPDALDHGRPVRKGALVLHGEQEFAYHRTPVAGDVLDGVQTITDIYEKETDSAHMTFVVMETVWTDAATRRPVVTERFNLIARLKK